MRVTNGISSWLFTPLTGCRCNLRSNTEGGSSYATREGWTADQVMAIEKQQLTELWDTHGDRFM
jgi:hypothetical protein